nr:glycosyltransferase family 92 protein [Nitrospira sp.]
DHKSIKPVLPIWDNVTVYRTERTDPHQPNILHNYTLKEFDTEWISLLDVDEFIVLHKHKSIPGLLQDYKGYGGLSINYLIYGSSGHRKRPEGNVKDNYVMRTPPNFPQNIVAKCILQKKYTNEIFNQHGATTIKPIMTEDHKQWNGIASTNSSRTLCRINHYYTRSWEEWKRKVEMGNREKWQQPRDLNYFNYIDRNCTVKDEILVGR